MPQNLIDTPAEWQDAIVVPAPGDPAAIANDPAKPHSLFHALAALAKRTRWLRGLLETHNHDGVYAPLVHHHDDRYYTRAEVDARKNIWAATISGSRLGGAQVSLQVTVPASGPYLIEGCMVWGHSGDANWKREFWIDGIRVYIDERHIYTPGHTVGGSWVDQIIYDLTAGTHSVQYVVTPIVVPSAISGTGSGVIKVTRL